MKILNKDEKYKAAVDAARQQIRSLEQSGVTCIPIEVAASFLPIKPEWER